MDHFSRSIFWKVVSLAFVAALFYVGYAISTRAGLPTADAQGVGQTISINIAQVGGRNIAVPSSRIVGSGRQAHEVESMPIGIPVVLKSQQQLQLP